MATLAVPSASEAASAPGVPTPILKPPVQFLDLKDQQTLTPPTATSTWSILDPTITIERTNGRLDVSARFNLEVKPYPVYSRGPNKSYPNARYIDLVRLTYHYKDDSDEHVTFDNPTSPEETYTVTQTALDSETYGGSVGNTGNLPSSNFTVSIMRGGQLAVEKKMSPWICNAGREALTTTEPKPRYSWEWISNLGEVPIIPDTAFRGKRWPITITRHISPSSSSLISKSPSSRNAAENEQARELLASILRFDLQIEILVRELGEGGLRSHREKWLHHFQPYAAPKAAYSPTTNRGLPLPNPTPPSRIFLGPESVDNITDADLQSIGGSLGISELDTDSLVSAKKRVHEAYQQSGVLATHIKTYTTPPPTPQKRIRVLRKLEVSEGKLNSLEEEHAIVEDKVWGKTKATFAAKNW